MSVLDKAGFRAIIAGLTGLSDGATRWALDPQAFISDQDRACVELRVFSITSLGVDEHRRDFGPPGYPSSSYVITEIGNRTLHITIRAETYDKGVEAAEVLDQIRTRIRAEAVRDQLNAINLAFVEAQPATMVSYQVDERVVSAAIADFTFAGIAQYVSDPDAPYIETVNTDDIVPGTLTQ